jgi:hypothetical protein
MMAPKNSRTVDDEIDDPVVFGLCVGHGRRLRVGVVLGEDPQRLGPLAHEPPADVADPLPHLIRAHDPELALRRLLDEHRGPGHEPAGLELPRQRDDVAVPDAANLDDPHSLSIYGDTRSDARSRSCRQALSRPRLLFGRGREASSTRVARTSPSGADDVLMGH